ncbi:AT-hook motif nuclear-localized protein 9 isoform X1 [Phalaenopsis equestris]|uniref:AT-hook motif nuclear-localized protein 9 isoform X1 n=1 Tax=Phalaenopsis equestris TaxID=78828 RepID=UPI0009E2718D|nr:AT-hook motif nuclear-localized protein 9 isoform X1 [Phalaenopsis equestris]XP_020598488.1 AT-hook motif nuclear-localized protein 9 isoform X1 [Phalaenopsis equestris]XP_020598495.1 AT-hook motif nuclear-localized protein 9 isoform X1 [Phalaenopsis equestris]XP_020598502.1 AT-hook motif nuclear-localized protein 9 isoform X1 [Phalaenopsis equestris]XP_020598510.1 AT-hook motif nuclear-localized protein 9 isoform X1 [Phalaenopsis equestris]XP_020598518.1 AT-hook motif nuclear-localized pro
MDGREGMGLSGPASYFMHRGMGAPGSGSQPSLHAPLGMSRSVPNLSPSFAIQTSAMGVPGGFGGGATQGSAFQASSPPTIAPHTVNIGPGGIGVGVGQGEQVKRKRGRPRKYGPDGSVSLALSPLSSPTSVSGTSAGLLGSGSGMPSQKRGRGRPPGTGRKQQLASLGEWVVGSAGIGFTPHIITIPVGEDIASKVMSFSQQGPRAVCILSANGAVSTVTLRQPATSGGTVTYEAIDHHHTSTGLDSHKREIVDIAIVCTGRFEILCLSGSYLITDEGGSRGRSGGLSVSLSSPDGRVIGGGVGGLLIAASPVQVIVGSFLYGGAKSKSKTKMIKQAAEAAEQAEGDKQSTPSSSLPSQSHAAAIMGGWTSARNAHVDIDLMRG